MIEWLPWGADAFARAAREGKPVLLSITAAWCRACHEMDRTTYADPGVAALIRDRFVPVRVDTDQRPDINERYNLGGWPTTAFLTARGEIVTGGTFVPVDRMPGVLARVADAFEKRAVEILERAKGHGDVERQPPAEPVTGSDRDLTEAVVSSFDEEYGGFGVEPKFPHAAPLSLAMALYRACGDPRLEYVVGRTLDAMFDDGLWDHVSGGFYRYSTGRGWRLPHREKLLDTNAALLRVYAEAALLFQRRADLDRCRAIAGFITGALRAEGGGYYGSDSDRILYADVNAAAAGALLAAATVLDDSDLGREALTSFERVVLVCYRPGLGVAHYFDGSARVRGLLKDQVAAIGAMLDAHDVSGGEPYRMMGEELAHLIVREMWDPDGVGFFDRAKAPDDIGLLLTRRKPFLENADGALALARLSRLDGRKGFSDPAGFREYAIGALRAAATHVNGMGPLGAHYALAERQLRPPSI